MRVCIDCSICSMSVLATRSIGISLAKTLLLQAVVHDATNQQLSSHNDAVFSVGGALGLQHGFRQRFVSYSMAA